jgi:hypothetical protein
VSENCRFPPEILDLNCPNLVKPKSTFMNTTQTTQDYNFIRATIKIANPTYTPEQLEEALQIRIKQLNDPNNDAGCDMCSG